jgi:hypothetical protein
MANTPQKPKLSDGQLSSLVEAQISSGLDASAIDCPVCCDTFTKMLRKPIVCPSCDYAACHNCYKIFLTSDGVSQAKCMKCNTEMTTRFLKQHFTDTFIRGEMREHRVKILYQQQLALLPLAQPRVEREKLARQKSKEFDEVERQMRELLIQKRILTDDIRFLRHSRGDGLYGSPNDAAAVSAFQHKCCDPDCRGYVSSAWKCGVCDKFSCTHCHEIKGTTKEETDAHVCDADTVETIKLMKADTKPCPGPGCGVYIHKTEGCDQMFCTSCKNLWSWKTGRIEERGHNPHYLEWMRKSGGAGAGAGGGGGMARDPADIQCGREIDRRFATEFHTLLTTTCSKMRNTVLTNWRPGTEHSILSEILDSIKAYDGRMLDIMQSVIHMRLHDIPNFREGAEVRTRIEKLQVSFMCKDITEEQFRKRVFRLHQDSEISRQILDLLVAVQNAATDIMYRIRDTFGKINSLSTPSSAQSPINPNVQINQIKEFYNKSISQMNELKELRAYASECMSDIYHTNSVNPKHRFSGENSFTILTPQ